MSRIKINPQLGSNSDNFKENAQVQGYSVNIAFAGRRQYSRPNKLKGIMFKFLKGKPQKNMSTKIRTFFAASLRKAAKKLFFNGSA